MGKESRGRSMKKYVCHICGFFRESIRNHPKCNHNQDEEGIPIPVVDMVEFDKYTITCDKTNNSEEDREQNKVNVDIAFKKGD